MPLDFNEMGVNNPYTWGSGRFYEGLRAEIGMLEEEDLMLASFEAAKYSAKKNGIISAYGANTN